METFHHINHESDSNCFLHRQAPLLKLVTLPIQTCACTQHHINLVSICDHRLHCLFSLSVQHLHPSELVVNGLPQTGHVHMTASSWFCFTCTVLLIQYAAKLGSSILTKLVISCPCCLTVSLKTI